MCREQDTVQRILLDLPGSLNNENLSRIFSASRLGLTVFGAAEAILEPESRFRVDGWWSCTANPNGALTENALSYHFLAGMSQCLPIRIVGNPQRLVEGNINGSMPGR